MAAGLRVLMSTWGWRSHFFSLVPLGWALQAAGHEVRVASHPAMTGTISSAGLAAVPMGEDLDFAQVFGGTIGKVRPLGQAGPGTAEAGDGIEPAITPDGGTVRFARALLGDLVAFGRAWQADLLIWEPFNLAAAVAAAVLKVPGVLQHWGPDSSVTLRLEAGEVIGPLASRYGLTAADVSLTGSFILDQTPPPMQVPSPLPAQPVRFVPYNGTAVVPEWLRLPPRGPRICVTAGHMMPTVRLAGRMDLGMIAGAVAELGLEVVVAAHPADQARLGRMPPNVRVADAPLAHRLVLPECAAFVHQGGVSTTMTAIACGVPQLILPQVSDQHFNGERVAVTGAGTWLDPARAGAADIRDTAAALVRDSHWREAAALMRERVRQMPPPAAAVPLLEALAAGHGADQIA